MASVPRTELWESRRQLAMAKTNLRKTQERHHNRELEIKSKIELLTAAVNHLEKETK